MSPRINSFFFIFLATGISFSGLSQTGFSNTIADTAKERQYTPYMYPLHGGKEGLQEFKQSHKYQYLKELWYYSESFYIRRDYFKEGISMDASQIAIPRFESYRKENEEAVVVLDGYKDVLVLLPGDKLIYKPNP